MSVGIDVSKDHLDVAVQAEGKRVEQARFNNDLAGLAQVGTMLCPETSGQRRSGVLGGNQ